VSKTEADKPVIILDAHWRRIDELFSAQTWHALNTRYQVVWGHNAPIPDDVLSTSLPGAFAYVAAEPVVNAQTLAQAPHLKLVAEVSGHFPDSIDYAACQQRNVEVTSSAPGFAQSVAEMGVAMALGMGRGLVREHEAFRRGQERWLDDCAGEDFTMYGADIGFVGYGSIAREIHRLLAPFGPQVCAYDPWLSAQRAQAAGVTLLDLPALMKACRCLFITAAPTRENENMIGGDLLAELPNGAVVVLISRAHLVDFDALLAETSSGRIKAAIDVFPSEPLAGDHPARTATQVLLSPHRAAAVDGGRHLIGAMLLEDLDLVQQGQAPQNFNRAKKLDVASLAGVGDAKAVERMGIKR
jgi:phosphoglycerate dehydrogenase-like enzyme